MLNKILFVVCSIVQNYTMKLFCALLIAVPFAFYLFGFSYLVKQGLLAMLYVAIIWAITPFFMPSSAIEDLKEFHE